MQLNNSFYAYIKFCNYANLSEYILIVTYLFLMCFYLQYIVNKSTHYIFIFYIDLLLTLNNY